MPGKLRVFFNASALPERPAGAGVYTLELGRALAARDDIDLVVAAPREVSFGQHLQTPPGLAGRTAWEMAGLGPATQKSEAQVYHGPHMFTPRTAIPTVTTVHDLTFHRLPRRYGFAHRRYYRYLAGTATRADRIVVPSSAVAADVVRFLGYPPERVRVVAEAPRTGLTRASDAAVASFRERYGLNGPYLAGLGTAEPGKRGVDAIRAMPALRAAFPSLILGLAGNRGWLSESLRREVARLGLGHAVRFLGYLPDEDLPAFLTGAEALVFPSLFEGFGLPPLEAMACGTPVIASNAPAMSQVLHGGAIFVPTRDPGAIAREVATLLSTPDQREGRTAAAMAFASRFSWTKAAEETVQVYRELAS